jgi:hypothetical protein
MAVNLTKPSDPFVPYRDRPALDKGERITWRDLESGMLFEPLAGTPSRRRVRGTPIPSGKGYVIGSEDLDGTPKGGILGTDHDIYRRSYDDKGRAVYTLNLSATMDACHAAEVDE